MDLDFRRIQFTPDLMPSDITGTELLEEDPATGAPASGSCRGRSSPTSCWPTKSIARRPRPRPRCSRRCRSTGSPRPARPCACRAVLRAGHAESDRAGRHLSAARSAARPLHVRHPGRVSRARTRRWRSSAHHRPRPRQIRRSSAAAEALALQAWCATCWSPSRCFGMWPSWCAPPVPGSRGCRPGCRSTCAGVPALEPGRRWCSAPRRERCSRDGWPWLPRTSSGLPFRCSGTGCCPILPPKPRESPPESLIADILAHVLPPKSDIRI